MYSTASSVHHIANAFADPPRRLSSLPKHMMTIYAMLLSIHFRCRAMCLLLLHPSDWLTHDACSVSMRSQQRAVRPQYTYIGSIHSLALTSHRRAFAKTVVKHAMTSSTFACIETTHVFRCRAANWPKKSEEEQKKKKMVKNFKKKVNLWWSLNSKKRSFDLCVCMKFDHRKKVIFIAVMRCIQLCCVHFYLLHWPLIGVTRKNRKINR